ncbi:MAG TPA: hypothetical protein VF391_12180 [Dermatophilaceae bacterium]
MTLPDAELGQRVVRTVSRRLLPFMGLLFFVGYLCFEIPSNLALHRFGARRWMARIM